MVGVACRQTSPTTNSDGSSGQLRRYLSAVRARSEQARDTLRSAVGARGLGKLAVLAGEHALAADGLKAEAEATDASEQLGEREARAGLVLDRPERQLPLQTPMEGSSYLQPYPEDSY